MTLLGRPDRGRALKQTAGLTKIVGIDGSVIRRDGDARALLSDDCRVETLVGDNLAALGSCRLAPEGLGDRLGERRSGEVG